MELNRKTTGIVLLLIAGVIGLVLIVCIVMYKSAPQETSPQNVYIEHPDADVNELADSKLDSYIRGGKSRAAVEDYWDEIGRTDSVDEDPLADISNTNNGTTSQSQLDELRKRNEQNQIDILGTGSSRTTNNTDSVAARAATSKPSQQSGTRKGKTSEQILAEHRAASNENMRRYQNGEYDNGLRDQPQEEQEDEVQEAEPEDTVKQQVIVKRSGNFSSFSDGNFGSSSSFTSLEDQTIVVSDNTATPIKCMFVRDEKLETGQRVAIRLLEDIIVGNVMIPKNTHIMSVCSISQRLEIKVSSIDINGKIIPLNYEAYDTDGAKGIYCPNIDESAKEDAKRGGLQIGRRPISRMGTLAKDIADIGMSIAETTSNKQKITVRVPSGYTFYLLPGKI